MNNIMSWCKSTIPSSKDVVESVKDNKELNESSFIITNLIDIVCIRNKL
jgi:hypothetical protein